MFSDVAEELTHLGQPFPSNLPDLFSSAASAVCEACIRQYAQMLRHGLPCNSSAIRQCCDRMGLAPD